MSHISNSTIRLFPSCTGSVILILLVCLCVVFQMLGVPVTLLGLLMSDAPVESFSEDFSIPPNTLEPSTPIRSHFTVESPYPRHLPGFSTLVFHPPQA